MLTFLTIGYGSSADYEATEPALRDKAHAHDAWLVEQGAVIGAVETPTQVRNPSVRGVTRRTAPSCAPTCPWRVSPCWRPRPSKRQ